MKKGFKLVLPQIGETLEEAFFYMKALLEGRCSMYEISHLRLQLIRSPDPIMQRLGKCLDSIGTPQTDWDQEKTAASEAAQEIFNQCESAAKRKCG